MFSRNSSPEKLTLAIEPLESTELAACLGADIAARFGPRHEAPLCVSLRGADGALAAGLNGVVHWRWLYIRHLWVAEPHRGQGLAKRLMQSAEDAARENGAIGAYIDTFEERVAGFYERQGYARFGALADFPFGGRRIYLSKRFPGGGNG